MNKLQIEDIRKLVDTLRGSHEVDIKVRKDAQDIWFEADWLEEILKQLWPRIEKGVPIPTQIKPSRQGLLQKMEIGDSVLFVGTERQQVFDWYSTPSKRLGMKIKLASEQDGIRMWRIK